MCIHSVLFGIVSTMIEADDCQTHNRGKTPVSGAAQPSESAWLANVACCLHRASNPSKGLVSVLCMLCIQDG